jgi:hypothetical protein
VSTCYFPEICILLSTLEIYKLLLSTLEIDKLKIVGQIVLLL